MTNWKLAARADKMNPSVLREILKVAERPGVISLAGGLPSPATFPVAAFAAACATVLANDGAAALQYAASEGHGPLRQAVADMLPWNVDPAQVLITTGSQQGLDLVAKVLLDAGLVTRDKRGVWAYFRLVPGALAGLAGLLTDSVGSVASADR